MVGSILVNSIIKASKIILITIASHNHCYYTAFHVWDCMALEKYVKGAHQNKSDDSAFFVYLTLSDGHTNHSDLPDL